MRALWKTIVGDWNNLAVVSLLVAISTLFVHTNHAYAAAFIVPPAALAGVAWLATR